MNVSAFTSFTKYSHLHQVRVLKMFLQDSVISDCKLLKANKLQLQNCAVLLVSISLICLSVLACVLCQSMNKQQQGNMSKKYLELG